MALHTAAGEEEEEEDMVAIHAGWTSATGF